ncbi:MAG: hypothetical protein RL291_1466 [Pseudomonadota bacterium]|jgi:TRAP-type mannitol/chloroaromatic compound transport system permease small subunit
MQGFLGVSQAIDWVNEKIGTIANWLVLLCCLVSAGNATLRYGLNYMPNDIRDFLAKHVVTNAALELQWYMFAYMVMLGAAYTLKKNEHVRVDLVYGNVSENTQNWIDVLGCIFFLLPMCVLMVYITWPWFIEAWRTGESSSNAGGLLRWPVKLALPVGFALLFVQGISELIKSIASLNGYVKTEGKYERPLQ